MTEEEYCEEYIRKAYMKELSEEAKLQALREIKEDLKEIKDTLKKMQDNIKLLEKI
jgi:tRNA(Phe) wybutosine-synthesizing methylase Tyw3